MACIGPNRYAEFPVMTLCLPENRIALVLKPLLTMIFREILEKALPLTPTLVQ